MSTTQLPMWAVVILSIAGTLIPAAGGLATFYWSYIRQFAKRQNILDFATKHVGYWKASLEVELLAAADESEQKEAKARTYIAMQKIRSHASQELSVLNWSTRISRDRSENASLRMFVKKSTKLEKTRYFFLQFLALIGFGMYLLIAAVLVVVLVSKPWKGSSLALAVAFISGAAIFTGFMGREADKIRFKQPKPLLDEL